MKASTKNKPGYWMVKQEPETYSWDDFVRDGGTDWSGVRNYQARNNLRSMKPGDKVLFPRGAGFDVRLAGTAVKVMRRVELIARVHD